MNIPENIKRIIDNKEFNIDNVGVSSSQVIYFDDMVLKTGVSQNEIEMMNWLYGKLPVPKVIAYENNCLLMSKIEGKMLCDDEYMINPNLLVSLLAKTLNMLWSVDISDCPCDFTLDKKLKIAEYRVENNLCDVADAEPETFGKDGFENPEALLKWLIVNKPNETLCLSHGDFCLPNIFAVGNQISGFIDLGRCGIADKYQDLALCYRSLKHNAEGRFMGKAIPNFNADDLFTELGIMPYMDLMNYYILLDELF